jgi:hypothetical protein
MEEIAGYRELLELARREEAMIAQGRWAELDGVAHAWDELVDRLPSRPPAAARSLLEDARRVVDQNVRTLTGAIQATRDELLHVAQGRRALGGYGRSGAAQTSRFVDELIG